MAVRMMDVALRAGVSLATVSHVLNKTRYVASETREKVLEAARELDYYKNAHARRLARGGSDFLGLIISDIENPFFAELVKAFESLIVKRGLNLLLCATNYDAGRTEAAVRTMIENDVRGVAVLTSQAGQEVAAQLKGRQIPSVFLGLGVVQNYLSNIRVNYSLGARQAVSHLLELGHRDFAFISGPPLRRSATEYRDKVVAAFNEKGVNSFRVLEGNQRVDGGGAAVRALLAQPNGTTALMCSNDLTAIGAMMALEAVGLHVPQDVSVVGSDDIYFAQLTRPPLTTVRLPRDVLAKLAFEALEKMVRSKKRQGSEYVLNTELVVRQSTARVNRSDTRSPASLGPQAAPPAHHPVKQVPSSA